MKRTICLGCAAVALAGFGAGVEPLVVDFSKEVGAIRKLNGMCNATPLYNSRVWKLNDRVLKLEIPYYRFHDSPLENPGIALVDVSHIFPIFGADPNDPKNYVFKPTDDYLKQAVDAGAQLEFRLGESIEHAANQYRVNPPPDYEKWADICCHIIRHYNEGWANGFKWDIRYWSIWEEPDTNPMLLTGAPEPHKDIYLPFYAVVSKRIRKDFPHLKICGPQGGGGMWHMTDFVDYFAAHKLPLDCYIFSHYTRDPEVLVNDVRTVRKYLDDHGYAKTEIAIGEWHLGPVSWDGWECHSNARSAKAWTEELTGYDSSAFTAAVLARMQDEKVARMYFYSMMNGEWGIFDVNHQPFPVYYALMAFAQLAHGETRVAAATVPRRNWYMLASKEKKTGKGRVLVSAYRADEPLDIVLKGGVKPVSVRSVDPLRDFEEVSGWTWSAEKSALHIPRSVGDSVVWLIETEPSAR